MNEDNENPNQTAVYEKYDEETSEIVDFDENSLKEDKDLKDQGVSLEEFVIYSSPRYYRLIFSQFKPTTKSGDLVSALGELKREKFLTYDSDWTKIKLTKKGNRYKKLIKQLLDIEALHVPQSTGIFDYRSEQGRKVIIELIRFVSAKLNFYEYSQYLNLPVFEREKSSKEFLKNFRESDEETPIDFSSEEGRQLLENFLKKLKSKNESAVKSISKTVFQQSEPIQFSLGLIKKFLRNTGLNRPEPLFNHFNIVMPKLFGIHERQFSVLVPELQKIIKILEENIEDFHKDENKWLKDYFQLLGLESGLFGFHMSEFSYASKEMDAFLSQAMLGPKIIASQYSTIKDLGELNLIIFPINSKESIVISGATWDMLYYFTLPTDQCIFKTDIQLNSLGYFPDFYISNLWRFHFGNVVDRARILLDIEKQLLKSDKETEKEIKKEREDDLKLKETALQEQLKALSKYSASFYSVCHMIAQKFSPNFEMHRCFCIFKNGLVTMTRMTESPAVMTNISIGNVQFGSELNKKLKEISESMEEILDIASDDN
jgi:hypothetical protein